MKTTVRYSPNCMFSPAKITNNFEDFPLNILELYYEIDCWLEKKNQFEDNHWPFFTVYQRFF